MRSQGAWVLEQQPSLRDVVRAAPVGGGGWTQKKGRSVGGVVVGGDALTPGYAW